MSLFFDKNLIINELGVKGGATLEDDDANTPTPDDNDTPTGDGPVDPPEDNDSPTDDGDDGPTDPPEDNNGPTDDDDDGPTDSEDNDGPTDDDDGPTDPEDNDTPSDDSSTDGGDTNELPDDTPSDNDSTDNDDIDDGPIDDDDDSTDDGDMEDFDDTKQKTLSDLEDNIFSSLTPEQKAIKVVELKGSYVELFKACDDILEKINLIPKENSTIEVFENITNTLLDLKTYIEYYISRTYDTRSYLENEVTLQKYTTIFNAVKEMFKEISKRK